MNSELSLNTQAILLLTAPLLVGKAKSPVRPLTLGEYGKLAQSLNAVGRQPADLLLSGAGAILGEIAPGIDHDRIGQLLERGFLLGLAVERWQERAIWVVSRADPSYPRRYKQRLGNEAPPVLYGCGDVDMLSSELPALAVEGSRNADDAILEYAANIGRLAAGAQCAIVSGGARGVDRAAMFGALSESGVAVGVLGDGLEKSALNRDNRDALMDNRLTLISPYDPNAGFNIGNLMQRNKLVYALADAGLIVESDYNKGGTWTGAVEQLEKMRREPIPIYTRSTGEIGKGLQALLRKGAIEWPNPQTAGEFGQVLAGQSVSQKPDASYQGAFALESNDAIDPTPIADVAPDTAPDSVDEHGETDAMRPADALFVYATELLNGSGDTWQDSDAAEYWGVPKGLARDWLKRLVDEGKYRKENKPVRYTRIP